MRESEHASTWARPIAAATAIVAAAYLGLAFIPDRLVAFLTTRVSPNTRDLLVTGYFVVAFLALSWAFFAAQRWERPG
ncbi:MAG TPA: hypothetical protein VE669_00330 [Actinomycetota bacterium]|nr:hypothetical protein [Actinomycetota bacterium]